MSDLPNELRYTSSHEWVRLEDNNIVAVGITDHAQGQLGELVFVELPEVDSPISSGEEIAVVESVKTAADVYSPLTGQIVEVNEDLADRPELVNQDPYGQGWLFKLQIENAEQLNDLLDAESYQNKIED